MKILVTGGAGFIGSHTVKELLRKGFDTVILDNFSSGRRELVLGGEVIEADLREKASLIPIFRSQKIDAVLHFASLTQVEESYKDPQKYYAHNLTSTLNLLEAMLRAGTKRIIFSSSATVYGIPQQIPIPETHPLSPPTAYGMTKYFVEKILQDYHRAYGMKFISFRYFNAAGADPEGQLGELHDPETHLIPNILLSLLGEKKDFNLFGTDHPTPDGTAIRDYVHVTDLAMAHVMALNQISSLAECEFINLGANQGFSVLEIIKKVEKVTGKKVEYRKKPKRVGDVAVLLASKEKAEQLLGWKPQHSDIETIIETAWNWFLKKAGKRK